jgi:solute carrier family 35 protein F5
LLYVREVPGEEDYDDDGDEDSERNMQRQALLNDHSRGSPDISPVVTTDQARTTGRLGLRETAKLSVQFCMLWFLANYFAIACLQYTNVGSTTILTSTSGVWTLILGTMIGVEKFTVRKFMGVIASLVGVILISRVDMSSHDEEQTTPNDADENGSFPHKTTAEIALGDAMAAFSAIVYGVYTIVMKKQVGDESRVNMQLFFGLVGVFNVFLLWPGFVILHLLGVEEFSLPPTNRVWTIILVRPRTPLPRAPRGNSGGFSLFTNLKGRSTPSPP